MRPRVQQIHQSGATDGQYLVYDNVLGYWKPATLPALPTHAHDLTTTYAPLTTDIAGVPDLVWDSDNSLILTELPIP